VSTRAVATSTSSCGVAGDIWEEAAENRITVREALERRLGDFQVIAKGEQLTAETLRRADPVLDLALMHTPHGGYTHAFDFEVFKDTDLLGSAEAVRRFLQLIGDAKGPDATLGHSLGYRTLPLWQLIWEALVDDFEESQINNPAELGPLLQDHLGLPWFEL
jgi:hypothetical protein